MNDIHDHQNQTFLLKQFIQDWTVLEAGGQLLPLLLKFYQWLHKDLAYVLTKENAREHSIKEIVDAFTDQLNLNQEECANEDSELHLLTVPHNSSTDLKQLYATLKGMQVKHVLNIFMTWHIIF